MTNFYHLPSYLSGPNLCGRSLPRLLMWPNSSLRFLSCFCSDSCQHRSQSDPFKMSYQFSVQTSFNDSCQKESQGPYNRLQRLHPLSYFLPQWNSYANFFHVHFTVATMSPLLFLKYNKFLSQDFYT